MKQTIVIDLEIPESGKPFEWRNSLENFFRNQGYPDIITHLNLTTFARMRQERIV